MYTDTLTHVSIFFFGSIETKLVELQLIGSNFHNEINK